MQWDSIISSLIGSSPATALCALAVRALWTRLQERDATIEALNQNHRDEAAALNQARIADFKEILSLIDSSPKSVSRRNAAE